MGAIAVADAWSEHDEVALARLIPQQRRAQVDARCALHDFVDDYQDAGEESDEQAVYHSPRWQVVAGMKDLLAQIIATAEDACSEDEPD